MDFEYDFSGWVTHNDVLCTDGRTIKHNAFAANDGAIVPLVWNHQRDSIFNTLGKVLLENRDNGVYGYGKFNDTEQGQNAKLVVEHGDVVGLSIYANQLKQNGNNVIHGNIREVSLVYAGANPKAFIESVITHGDGEDATEEAILFIGKEIELHHAEREENKDMTNETEEKKEDPKKEETVGDVFETLTEKQKKAVYALLEEALKDESESETETETETKNKTKTEDEGESEMKQNVFDQDTKNEATVLSHADYDRIFTAAKRNGSLRDTVNDMINDGTLAHSIDTTDMEVATGTQDYGFNDASMLFPTPKSLNNTPEFISRETSWVRTVMGGVHRTPFSRIKSVYANITEDAARAKGYLKGHQKATEVFTTLKRTTSPQTVYKLQKMDRDDIIDITDFDVVAWIKSEMRTMLDEEIARAILIGDGRPGDDEAKIKEDCIRPIATDVPLFNTKVKVASAKGATGEEKAKAVLDAAIRNRKNYKGSGNPTLFTTEDWLSEFLLLEDGIGHKMYKSVEEIATALRVKNIVTVEAMEGYQIDNKPLIGVMVNLADYNVGADRGGAVALFDDFDIDYNKYSYLIETRISGALVKPFSAITFIDDEATA